MSREPQNMAPRPLTAAKLAGLLRRFCPGRRLDLAGAVSLPSPLPHRQKWLEWLDRGFHGGLDYLTRDPELRTDPTRRSPQARSLLVFAQRYTRGWQETDPDPVATGKPEPDAPWTARVSRYARGRDYHDVLLQALKGVIQDLKTELPDLVAHASTDTGPYLEREYAWLAGLGFLGKNHCLIHEKLGSGLFLGVALTNLDITGLSPPGVPAPEPLFGVAPRRIHPAFTAPLHLCGRCTRCLDACPTAALDPERGLDANRCLSTWTIEWRGQAPVDADHRQGGLLFGCDICQSVCPWNHRAASRAGTAGEVPAEYGTLPEHAELTLADLAEITDQQFRQRFRQTPIWRCHPEGMRRNARRVLKNLAKGEES